MRLCAVVKCTFQRQQDSCVQIFSILAAWKCVFCRFVKSTFQGTSQSVKIFYPFQAWKCDFPSREIHVSSFVWANFAHVPSFLWVNFLCFGRLKFDCCRIVKRLFQCTSQRVEICFIFETWKCDFAQSWNPRSKVSSFVGAIFPQVPSFEWANYQHCVCLKMHFLPIRETILSRYLAKSGNILIIFFTFFIFPRWEIYVSSWAWLRLAWFLLAWLSFASFRFAWLGLAWLGLACLGLAWLGLAWLGLAWIGIAWLG